MSIPVQNLPIFIGLAFGIGRALHLIFISNKS